MPEELQADDKKREEETGGEILTDLKQFIKEHPYAVLWGIIGIFQIILSVLIMDGYLEMREDANLGTVMGFAGMVWGAVVVFMGLNHFVIDELKKKNQNLQDRIDYLEDQSHKPS